MNYIKGAKFFILTLNHHSSSFHLAHPPKPKLSTRWSLSLFPRLSSWALPFLPLLLTPWSWMPSGPLEAGQPSDLPEDRVVAATPTVSLSSMKPVRLFGVTPTLAAIRPAEVATATPSPWPVDVSPREPSTISIAGASRQIPTNALSETRMEATSPLQMASIAPTSSVLRSA